MRSEVNYFLRKDIYNIMNFIIFQINLMLLQKNT